MFILTTLLYPANASFPERFKPKKLKKCHKTNSKKVKISGNLSVKTYFFAREKKRKNTCVKKKMGVKNAEKSVKFVREKRLPP